MQVRFKNNWLGPDGHLYRARTDGKTTYVPNFKDAKLPFSAVIVSSDQDAPEAAPGNPKADLHDADLERAGGDLAEQRRVKAEEFARRLRESVGSRDTKKGPK